jgi:hypothetical protein
VPHRLVSLAALALALMLGACGGDEDSSSDKEQITKVINDSYAAFADGDAEAFCATLSPDYLKDFKDYYGGCDTKTLKKIKSEIPDSDLATLGSPKISHVTVEEDSAEATVNGEDLELTVVYDEYYLDDFDVPGGE